MKQTVLATYVLVFHFGFAQALAQQPAKSNPGEKAPAAPAHAAPATAPVPTSQAVVVPTYKYEAKGRRDPFRSLDVSATIQASAAPTVRAPGLKGQLVSEINLAGIVKSKNQYMAMATGYRGKTYFLQPNDDLYDGKVIEIKSDAVIFSQTLTDGQGKRLSQRVVKKLYPTRGEGNDAK
jgi:Tfp pilus assembly protein PilP